MKVILAFLIVIILGIGVWYTVFLKNQLPQNSTFNTQQQTEDTKALPTTVNYSAGFAIFTNGTFRIFTAEMYHNLSDDVYIESSNPNIVHVKKANLKWDDFFKTLPMKLSRSCLITGTNQTFCTNTTQTLKFYINGKLDEDALNQEIKDKDQLLVSYGNEENKEIESQFKEIPKVE